MAGRKAADYDDGLVEMLGDGGKTYGQIAETLGLSEAYVGKVARGGRRAETPYGVTTNRKGPLPRESDGIERPDGGQRPGPAAAEVEEGQVVVEQAGSEERHENDGSNAKGQIRTYTP